MQERSRRALAVVVIAAFGLGLSLVIESIHRRLSADVSYASFCNVNSSVNCDVVLTSSYAELAGVSVAVLAALYYLGLIIAGIALLRSRSASQRQTLAASIFALASVGFAFSLYLAIIAVAVLHAICLLCGGLYVVAVGMLVASWLLRNAERRLRPKDQAALAERERWAWVGGAAALSLLAIVVGWELVAGSTPLSAAEIERQRPDFYRHFFAQPVTDVPSDGRNVRGDPAAAVTIVEFSDFGCGHCAAFDRRIGELLQRGADVRLVFHHFPLDSKCNPAISAAASGDRCVASAAAECAAEQGRFWEYARTLFEHQPNFSTAELRDYARHVSLDLALFDSCLAGDEVHERVANDAKLGASLGIRSTPTLFLNGRRVDGDPGSNLADALVLAREGR